MRSLTALILIILGLTVIFQFGFNNDKSQEMSKPLNKTPLEAKIEADLEQLGMRKEIPYPWQSFREIRAGTINSNHIGHVPRVNIQIPTSDLGQNRLIYTLIPEQIDNPQSRLMVQFEVYDIASNSKLWEKIRIYDRN